MGVGVVPHAEAHHAIGALQLAGGHQLRLAVARHLGAVDHAGDLVPLHLQRDLLRDRLPLRLGLVNGLVRAAAR
ncbi:MAG: hypothetical protein ACK55I_51150, partial [bacterium]